MLKHLTQDRVHYLIDLATAKSSAVERFSQENGIGDSISVSNCRPAEVVLNRLPEVLALEQALAALTREQLAEVMVLAEVGSHQRRPEDWHLAYSNALQSAAYAAPTIAAKFQLADHLRNGLAMIRTAGG